MEDIRQRAMRTLEHYPVSWNQYDGYKSVHPGRRGAPRDVVHRASAATHPGGRFAPPQAGVFCGVDVVARPL